MQSSPLPCHLVPLRSKHPPQHPILENPQPTFRPHSQPPIFTTIQNRQNYIVLFYHNNCPLSHRFPPQSAHAHSEQWCYTSDLSALYMSLTNSTFLTAGTILWCTKIPVPNWWFSSPFLQKKSIIPCSCSASFAPLNLIYTSLIPWQLSKWPWPIQTSHIPVPSLICLVHW